MTELLAPLIADGVVEEVISRLKTGKEAELFIVVHAGEIVAAKVYKERHARNFRNNAAYKEGRSSRSSRTQRAMDKGSRFGQRAAEDAWKAQEYEALVKLHADGIRVPQPILMYEGVLLMELVIDPDGQPAPRLIDAEIPLELAAGYYADLRQQIIRMLLRDLIHGDLSPYNVLLAWNGPTIIDFPQVIGAAHNSQAERFFVRDLENIHRFFSGIDPALAPHASDAREIWNAYVRRELTPEFVPSGNWSAPGGKHAGRSEGTRGAHPRGDQHGGRSPSQGRDQPRGNGGADRGGHGRGAGRPQGADGLRGRDARGGSPGGPPMSPGRVERAHGASPRAEGTTAGHPGGARGGAERGQDANTQGGRAHGQGTHAGHSSGGRGHPRDAHAGQPQGGRGQANGSPVGQPNAGHAAHGRGHPRDAHAGQPQGGRGQANGSPAGQPNAGHAAHGRGHPRDAHGEHPQGGRGQTNGAQAGHPNAGHAAHGRGHGHASNAGHPNAGHSNAPHGSIEQRGGDPTSRPSHPDARRHGRGEQRAGSPRRHDAGDPRASGEPRRHEHRPSGRHGRGPSGPQVSYVNRGPQGQGGPPREGASPGAPGGHGRTHERD